MTAVPAPPGETSSQGAVLIGLGGGALRFVVSRALVLLGAATVAFLALHVLPGDPVTATLGPLPTTPEIVDRVRADLGTGDPLIVQYGTYLGHLARGNLGTSYQLNRPVTAVIGEQLGSTAGLAAAAAALGFASAFVLALTTCGPRRPRGRAGRRVAELVELTIASTPSFWVGTLLLTAFSFRLRLFPVVGDAGGIRALVLPAVTLALPVAAVLAQVLRGELDHALSQPFTVTARAGGLSERAVRWRAVRHALLPVATLAGWTAGSLLGLTGPTASVRADKLSFEGRSLLDLDEAGWAAVRGARIGLVLQDALAAAERASTRTSCPAGSVSER